MGDPELHADEKVLVTTQDVFVKSIPFEGILTNKRIILVDRKKNLIPTKDILLATVRDVEGGENAIRDQTITLSLITTTGEHRQLILTFPRASGGGRKRERDEWLRILKEQTSASIQKAIRKVVPAFDEIPKKRIREAAATRIAVTSRQPVKKEIEAARPLKKIVGTEPVALKPAETIPQSPPEAIPRIPVEPVPARPAEAIPQKLPEAIPRTPVEPVPAKPADTIPQKPPEAIAQKPSEQALQKTSETVKPVPVKEIPARPVETTSLPGGIFCSRCGNRVPSDSVFCNRCGSRMIPLEDAGSADEVAVSDLRIQLPERETMVTDTRIELPARENGPVERGTAGGVPQVSVDSSPVAKEPEAVPATGRKERPVEVEIRSIEPLIEGSVPRAVEAPPIMPQKPAESTPEIPVVREPAPNPPVAGSQESDSIARAARSIIDAAASRPTDAGLPQDAGSPHGTDGSRIDAGKEAAAPGEPLQATPPPQPVPPSGHPVFPPPPKDEGKGHRAMLVGALAVILVISLIGMAFIFGNFFRGDEGAEPVETPTPAATITTLPPTTTRIPATVTTAETTPATPAPTPGIIPSSGVWIRVVYAGTYRGSVGTAGFQTEVYETGEKFFAIPTSDGIVEASIEKKDGTNAELAVEVYRNGDLLERKTTTRPKGIVQIQADLRPPVTTTPPKTIAPTTVATTAPVATATTSGE